MENINKNIFFTFVSILIMIEMFVFDLIYMGDKRVIIFKIIGFFFMAWLVDVVCKGIKKEPKIIQTVATFSSSLSPQSTTMEYTQT